jgi:hypothetical protein
MRRSASTPHAHHMLSRITTNLCTNHSTFPAPSFDRHSSSISASSQSARALIGQPPAAPAAPPSRPGCPAPSRLGNLAARPTAVTGPMRRHPGSPGWSRARARIRARAHGAGSWGVWGRGVLTAGVGGRGGGGGRGGDGGAALLHPLEDRVCLEARVCACVREREGEREGASCVCVCV